jgi:hypothetical protein
MLLPSNKDLFLVYDSWPAPGYNSAFHIGSEAKRLGKVNERNEMGGNGE